MKKITIRSTQRAFTLLEILVALALFALAVSALLVLFPMAQRSERESDAEMRATLIASSIMEALDLPSREGLVRLEIGNTNSAPHWIELDPKIKKKQSVAYNSSCKALHPLSETERLEAIPDHDTAGVATLTITPKSSIPFLSTAEVEVAFPSSAPAANRTVHRYVRLLHVGPIGEVKP